MICGTFSLMTSVVFGGLSILFGGLAVAFGVPCRHWQTHINSGHA
jgi:hypothetical protein